MNIKQTCLAEELKRIVWRKYIFSTLFCIYLKIFKVHSCWTKIYIFFFVEPILVVWFFQKIKNKLNVFSTSHLALITNITACTSAVLYLIRYPGGWRHPLYRRSHLDCNSTRHMLKHQFISSRITHKTIWLLSADWGVTLSTLAAAALCSRRPLCCLSPGWCVFKHTAAWVTEYSRSQCSHVHVDSLWQTAFSVWSFSGFKDNVNLLYLWGSLSELHKIKYRRFNDEQRCILSLTRNIVSARRRYRKIHQEKKKHL